MALGVHEGLPRSRWRALGTLLLLWACWLGLSSTSRAADTPMTAFYYSSPVPQELLALYDQVVVQPSEVGPEAFAEARAEPVAYLSVGEVAAQSPEAARLDRSWVLARNAGWSSLVLDPGSPGYRQYVMGSYEALWQRGFRRFFLDTLDSYRLGGASKARQLRAQRGLEELITQMGKRHPQAQLILNRGFELLPRLAARVSGVVAESLFDRWDPEKRRYVRVPPADRAWLLERLREVQQTYGLPVTVVDYRPRAERTAARRTAFEIAQLGFEPWVTDAQLSTLGVGRVEAIARRILVLTNDAPGEASQALRWLSPVIEHLGYVAVHRNVRSELPGPDLKSVQAVVTWLSSDRVSPGYEDWLLDQVDAGVRLAMLGVPGFSPSGPVADRLGMVVKPSGAMSPTRVVSRDGLVGFEAEPPRRPFDGPLFELEAPGAVEHLRLADEQGRQGVAVATGSWGGLAFSHVLAVRGLEGQRAWVLDPFAFLRRALALPRLPVPDVTTENGRRLALFVVRGAGLSWPARLPEAPRTGQVLRLRLLEPSGWPHALELSGASGSEPSEADRAAAGQLLELTTVQAVPAVTPGLTRVPSGYASLTQVQSETGWDEAGWNNVGSNAAGPASTAQPLLGSIAPDLAYLPSGDTEAYAYREVLRTLQFTDQPRRLKPIFLDYHAFSASSPGGLSTLQALYDWVQEQGVYPLRLQDYQRRLQAFRQQVVARHLDGSVSFHGGEALRTVRVPNELGSADLSASSGVAVVRSLPQGHYVTFVPGRERRLAVAQAPPARPHLTQTNAAVRKLSTRVEPPALVFELELDAAQPLELAFGGLPAKSRCVLEVAGHSLTGEASPGGELSFRLEKAALGRGAAGCRSSCAMPARLSCPSEPARPKVKGSKS